MAKEPSNILTGIADRYAFRTWLEANHANEPECWVVVKLLDSRLEATQAHLL